MLRGPVAVAILLLSAGLSSAQAEKRSHHTEQARESAAARGFDGDWTVEAATTVGSCAQLVPTSLTIQGGRVTLASGAAGTPWGYVESDGTIVARFSDRGGHMARANGVLRGGGGSGTWSSNTDYCGGTWRAQRDNATSAAR
jgi:hypothetical protein